MPTNWPSCWISPVNERICSSERSSNDADELAELLDLSDEQIRSFTGVEPGRGLLAFGPTTLPFNARKDDNPPGPLVTLMNTKFQEK